VGKLDVEKGEFMSESISYLKGYSADVCKHYWDKGEELIDYYCPSGFRFLTNTEWICPDGSASQNAINLIQNCWKFYDSVSVGPAFEYNGSMMNADIAIYVKKVIPVGLGISCNNCGGFYEDKDTVHVGISFGGRIDICKNCFNYYSYKEIMVGNDIVLVYRG
jgi:hypothetical protein